MFKSAVEQAKVTDQVAKPSLFFSHRTRSELSQSAVELTGYYQWI